MGQSKSECNLGSARGLVRRGGELVAIPHKVTPTGYKAKNAYGAKAVFSGETTKSAFDKKVKKVGESTSNATSKNMMQSDGHVKKVGENTASAGKKLMPYYPNAPRNRPPESQENHIGTRFDIPPMIKTEAYRNMSHVQFTDVDPESRKPWKTTNQVFNETTSVRNTIGLANQGISSDVAKRTHQKQGIYT